jgi:hypothetical protein
MKIKILVCFIAVSLIYAKYTSGQVVFNAVSSVDKNATLWGLRYAEFVVPLVKAVQELNSKNEAQQKTIELLQQKVDAMGKLMDKN